MSTFDDEWEEGTENVSEGWSAAAQAPKLYGHHGQQSGARGDNSFSRDRNSDNPGYTRGGHSRGGFDRQNNGYNAGGQDRGGFDHQNNDYGPGGRSRRGFDRSDNDYSRGGQDRRGFDRQNNDYVRGNRSRRGFDRSDNDYSHGGQDRRGFDRQNNDYGRGGFDSSDKGFSRGGQDRGGFDRQNNDDGRGGFDHSDNGYSRGGQDRRGFDRQNNDYGRGGFDRSDSYNGAGHSGFDRQGNDYSRGGGQGSFNRRDDGGHGFQHRDSPRGNFENRESGFKRERGVFNEGGFNRSGIRSGRDDEYSSRGGGFDRGGFSQVESSSFRGSGFSHRNNEDELGFSSSRRSFGNDGGGFRGNRGRGRRGGGRAGFNSGPSRGFGTQDDDDDDGSGFHSRGGRGGGGRGHGDRRGGEGGEEKPREIYNPPEDTTDENEIYGSGISTGINFDKYETIDVKVTGDKVPPSITSFEASGLRGALVENVKKAGYRKPTPVQKSAIPVIMARRDLMACAQTGSGKTAAFLLPMLHTMMADNLVAEVSPEGAVMPYAIVLSPTRELAMQIYQEARKFALHTILKCAVVYGGTHVYTQVQKLAQGVHILVATPGRLDDLTNRGRICYSKVQYVVLDEADRMLDMGFLPAIEKFLNNTSMQPPGERVTLMFSATFPNEVQQLASKFLCDYLFLAVGIVGGACSDVEQTFHQVGKFEKRKQLELMLMEHQTEKTMVFVETKRTADFIATYLSDKGLPTTSIHGDRLQRQREEALHTFRFGTMKVLVATAVAARGLDIKGVEHVINYDLPKSIDEYVHRIGRTGRVGNCGKATSFYDAEVDHDLAPNLLRILVGAEQNVPEWLQQEASRGAMGDFRRSDFGGSDVRKFGGNTVHFSAPAPVEPEETWD